MCIINNKFVSISNSSDSNHRERERERERAIMFLRKTIDKNFFMFRRLNFSHDYEIQKEKVARGKFFWNN